MSWENVVRCALDNKEALPAQVADYVSSVNSENLPNKPAELAVKIVSDEGAEPGSHPDCNMQFDYDSCMCRFPKNSIQGAQIRYSWFIGNNLLAVSFWGADEEKRQLEKVVFQTDNIEVAFQLLCALRYVQVLSYEAKSESAERFVSTFAPVKVGLFQIGLDENPPADSPYSWLVLDEELVAIYADILDSKPKVDPMFFYTESGVNCVDKVILSKLVNPWLVVFESQARKIVIGNPAEEKPEGRFLAGDETPLTAVLRKLTPKSKGLFRDPDAYMKQLFHQGAEANPLTATRNPLPRPRRDEEGNEREIENVLLESLQAQLTPQQTVQDLDENLQMMWVMAKSEMEDMIAKGLVPGSSIISGGLDPDSVDHFKKCVDEIQEALFEQRYEIALSHMRGASKIFSESKNDTMKSFFNLDNELEVLERLFLCSLAKQ
ncbi:uncharacterized protein LOC106152082 [Lingula anatina]|uniref:Uncharacterized protein LOC106152082 n=1 Tax=Lingula anatina TaxID=7574 RepID=A0A1S3H4U5_LINAN|nr:uncharacterized protein LOC106152082 [Lingula anatina]|eukprot:XP_013381028.1 uncharacterized protein LOC106152082 [Lingula anatina]